LEEHGIFQFPKAQRQEVNGMAPARACAELYITVVISARVTLVTRALAATVQGLASWAHG